MTGSSTFETQFVTEQKLLARSLQSAKVKPFLGWGSQLEINLFERRYFFHLRYVLEQRYPLGKIFPVKSSLVAWLSIRVILIREQPRPGE